MKIKVSKRIFIFILSIVSILCLFIFAQRGLRVVIKTSEGTSFELYQQYRALVIGITDYSYYPRLPNAVRDAREVASLLKSKGFTTTLLENPTSSMLKKALHTLIFRECRPEDGVLIYFAGHGETMRLADGKELGYIVPKDCPLLSRDSIGFVDKAISMDAIQTYSLQLKAKHLLVVFDSCFSGSIFALQRAAPADISYKTAKPVRQYITAGGEDESVPDKSIFKECFLEALKGDADANSDGYVTGSELGMYLESKVVNYTSNAQHPQYGKIRNIKLDKGDFVFVLEKAGPGVQEEIPTPPKAEKLDLSSLEESAKRREESQRIWNAWQEHMKSDFNKVKNIDENPMNTAEEKKIAWDKFLNSYSDNNPFSRGDEQMRQEAAQRIKELSKPEVSVGARVSLRSSAHSLSWNEGESMVKRKNFFDSSWNKSGGFENEYESKTINGDKVVLDHSTGLMWHQSGSEEYMTYEKAKQWIAQLNRRGYGSYHDWRLPTLEEGASLLESKEMNGDLYIDPKFSAKQRWIWTSDTVTDYVGQVWVVYFDIGFVRRFNVGSAFGFVRPVRSGLFGVSKIWTAHDIF